MKIEIKVWLLGADNLREILEAHLVAILELSIILSLRLDSIVREMHCNIGHVIQGVLFTARPNITILIAVAFHTTIDARTEAEATEVKLALVHQQRVVNVLLNNECAIACIFRWTPNYRLDFFQRFDHCDASAAIRVLTRLDDPGILGSPIL